MPTRRPIEMHRSWILTALAVGVAAATSAVPLAAQSGAVAECRPVAENGVDATVRYRPTTPNPLSHGHGLDVVAALDGGIRCMSRVAPDRTTTLRGLAPGHYTYHMLWNPVGKLPLTVPDTSFAFAIVDIGSEFRAVQCVVESMA